MHVRDLQDRFLDIVENARDIISLYDRDGRRIYANRAGREIGGVETGGKDAPFMRIDPMDRERIRAEYAELVRTGEQRRVEFRYASPDNVLRLMQSETSPVRDESGAVVAVLAISRNVTEERRGEAALKATLETLFEQAPIGISITDLEGHFLRANPRMRQILGYEESDLTSRNVWEVSHESDRGRTDKLRADLVSGRTAYFAMEKRIVRADSEVRWVNCSAGMVRPPFGGRSFVIEIADDITERKHIDDALREREELLEAIFEHAPIGISITDMDGRFVSANPRFRRVLGYTEEDLHRLTGWDLIPGEDMAENRRLREQLFTGEREDFSWERRYIRKDGDILWTRNTVALVRDAGGAPRWAVALSEDITQRRLADAAIYATADKLHSLTHRLVELQEAERRHIARELHDRVGQTLTALRINLDMIRSAAASDEALRHRADDSLELIESAFKAVEGVMYDLRPPMIDEYGVIESLKWYAKNFTERTGLQVEVRGDSNGRCSQEAELTVFRIAQEALNNVVRHAQARRVMIKLQEERGEIVVAIEDDGIGFDSESQRTERRGYGLVTMRERAEAVGGSFEAQSEEGKGTRIIVRVKCVQ